MRIFFGPPCVESINLGWILYPRKLLRSPILVGYHSYIVEFEYDPTCNYYERGKYGCRNFHVAKLPLVMLILLLFLSASLHMLVFACLDNLFAYKMPMHRKYVRLRCVCHVFHDALFALQFSSFMRASLKLSMPS